jgi:hypothetical protein
LYRARAQLKKCYNIEEAEENADMDDVDRLQAYTVGGGFPIIEDLAATYDYDEHIGVHVDKDNITGFASFRRLQEEPTAAGRPTQSRTRSAEVHVLQFFKPRGSDKALMRYKTSAQSRVWYPPGPDGTGPPGIEIFKEGAVLPGLADIPPLAEFKRPWKREEEVKEAILNMHNAHPHHMTPEQHEEWVQFFLAVPESADDVEFAARPLYRLEPRHELARDDLPPPMDSGVDRSVLDPPNRPLVPPITDRNFPPGARKRMVEDILTGAFNGGAFR